MREVFERESPHAGGRGARCHLIRASQQDEQFRTPFSGLVEETADRIIAQSDDPDIQQNARLWKIQAIPACQKAIFFFDPLIALTDTWTFCIQMHLYFTEGAGKDLFGEWQSLADETSERLEADMEELARQIKISGDVQMLKEKLYEWASDHPIEKQFSVRESVRSEFVAMIEDMNIEIAYAVGNVAVTLHDIREELFVHFDHLPKQLRWQVDYLLGEAARGGSLEKSVENFSRITESVDRAVAVLEEAPATLDLARALTLEDIDRQRIESIEELRDERIALVEELRNERIAVFEELDRMKNETVRQLDSVMMRALDESSKRLDKSIDHIFWRALQLVAILVAVAAVFFAILIRRGALRT